MSNTSNTSVPAAESAVNAGAESADVNSTQAKPVAVAAAAKPPRKPVFKVATQSVVKADKADKPKSVSKPAAKPAAKPVAKPVAKAAAEKAKKPIVKKTKAATPAEPKPAVSKPVATKPAKEKKVKLVRDSIAIPKPEYAVLEDLKLRAGKLAHSVKKTELIRAGIKALAAMADDAFLASVRAVPSLKTGRPSKQK